jgi:hypothetical protein
MWDKLKTAALWGFLAAIPLGIVWITFHSGEESLVEIAVENDWCETEENCAQADIDLLVEQLVERTEYSGKTQITWCLGVDSFADTRVRRGGAVKGLITSGMYLACPS